jgi:cation:H+ antiporter
VAGSFLSGLADRLADRTGMGEAMMGMLVLAAATSLPDLAATLSAATAQRPSLAMSNVMGSMAVNLAFLGVADLAYRRANLEHAAASAPNLLQACLLIVLLALPLLAALTPRIELLGVHPVTPFLVAAYLFGIRLVRSSHVEPMWAPRRTRQTRPDVPQESTGGRGVAVLWAGFAGLTAITAGAGWALMEAAQVLVDRTELSEGVAGGLFTAAATSTPELVTTIAAVRRGALTLAVANIFGTNCFNTLIIAAADLGYGGGSIYHAIAVQELFWGLVAILMSAVLLLGMLRRETYGIGNIGFESVFILLIYGVAAAAALVA